MPGAVGALASRLGIAADDLLELLVIARSVLPGFEDFSDLRTRLDGRLDRLRKLLHVARVDLESAIRALRLLVQVSCKQRRLGTQVRSLRLRRDALVVPRGLGQLARLAMNESDLLGRFLFELVARVGTAEALQYVGRSRPVLQADQCGSCVAFARPATLRGRPPRPIRGQRTGAGSE